MKQSVLCLNVINQHYLYFYLPEEGDIVKYLHCSFAKIHHHGDVRAEPTVAHKWKTQHTLKTQHTFLKTQHTQ